MNSCAKLCIVLCLSVYAWGEENRGLGPDQQTLSGQAEVQIGDSDFALDLIQDTGGIHEIVTLDNHRTITSVPWMLQIDGKTVTPEQDSIHILDRDKKKQVSPIIVKGTNTLFDWTLKYSIEVSSCVTKTLTLKAHRPIHIDSVSLWNAASEVEPVVASTSLLDICAFYRGQDAGCFVSLDFPYSKIKTKDGVWSVTYPPREDLAVGRDYVCHALTIGRTQLVKNVRYGFDDGEVEAMDHYVQTRVKPRFGRPMTVTAGINNRYTQVADGEVFYTMKDNPTLSWHTDWLEKDIKLMSEIGLEHYQVWPGPFDATLEDPDPAYVKKFVKYANRLGVRVGDYSATEQLFCDHYNFYNNHHAQFGITPEECHFGNKKFVDLYIARTTEYCKKYGFEIHCLDFLKIWKRAEGTADEELVYAQVRGLTQVLEAINSVSENMMTWSNSGVWAELLPKIAWYNHNLYLTDPYMDKPWHGLNMTRLLDDVRREQMVMLHYSRFIPYRYLSNVQYFFCQNSIVPDTANYQFGALSTLAVVPNLGFGELRFWLETLPDSRKQSIIQFYRKWLGLIKDNYDLWTTAYNAGDKPGIGGAEIYSHARDDHGYIFLVNPNYWSRKVAVPLNEQLGFKGNQPCEIRQLYPDEKWCLTNIGPVVNLGQQLQFTVPARQVMVLHVQPASQTLRSPKVYGIPAVIESTKKGYRLKTAGPQGSTQRFVVHFPQEINVGNVVAEVCPDIPKQRQRSWKPTPFKVISRGQQSILYEITFRRQIAPKELSAWKVLAGDLKTGVDAGWPAGLTAGDSYDFPLFNEAAGIRYPMWPGAADLQGLGTLANFCGGYIENSFSEDQETYIDITTSADSTIADLQEQIQYNADVPAGRPLPNIAREGTRTWWLQNEFDMPFMYGYGCEPPFQEHMFIALPFINNARIKTIQAWINGRPASVQEYKYPRNRSLGCYYIDLVGSSATAGNNRVVLYFESIESK